MKRLPAIPITPNGCEAWTFSSGSEERVIDSEGRLTRKERVTNAAVRWMINQLIEGLRPLQKVAKLWTCYQKSWTSSARFGWRTEGIGRIQRTRYGDTEEEDDNIEVPQRIQVTELI